jgi:hypothetical protein
VTTPALLPAPVREPRWCRYCGRPIPVGPVIGGAGSGCARKHGLTAPPAPRIPQPGYARQDGPDLLDPLAAVVSAAAEGGRAASGQANAHPAVSAAHPGRP